MRHFLGHNAGALGARLALLAAVVAIFAALSFGYGNATRIQTSLQEAADRILQKNDWDWQVPKRASGSWGRIFSGHGIQRALSAVVTGGGGNRACIIALHPDATRSLSLYAGARIDMPDCEIHVASSNPYAVWTEGTSSITSERTCTAGGFAHRLASTGGPDAAPPCSPTKDPYAQLAEPKVRVCTHRNERLVGARRNYIAPAVFCGGLEITDGASAVFGPGEYVIKGGDFRVDGHSLISGRRVFFYLQGDETELVIGKDTTVSLTAPPAGPFAGILFHADSSNRRTHFFDSNSAALIDGAFYFPAGKLSFNSDTTIGAASNCAQFVASQIQLNDETRIRLYGDHAACPRAQPQKRARLVRREE